MMRRNVFLSIVFGLVFMTSSVSAVIVENDGKFGFGTETPQSILHIKQNYQGGVSDLLRLENSAGGAEEGASILFEISNQNGYGSRIEGRRDGSSGIGLRFFTGDISSSALERMRISSNGRVGIGTTNPDPDFALTVGYGGLKVNAQSGSMGFKVYRDEEFLFNKTSFDSTKQYSEWGPSPIVFTQGGATRLYIDSSGHVGIGSTVPVGNLEVKENNLGGLGGNIVLSNEAGGANDVTRVQFRQTSAVKSEIIGGREGSGGSYLAFKTETYNGGTSEKMRINQTGSVGIGTTIPKGGVHILTKTVPDNSGLVISGSDSGTGDGFRSYLELSRPRSSQLTNTDTLAGIKWTGQTDTPGVLTTGAMIDAMVKGQYTSGSAPTELRFKTSSVGSSSPETRLVILENGNVGIGLSNPTVALEVNGVIQASEIKIPLENWADFVFETDYDLMPLNQVDLFTRQFKHLPSVPSERELKSEGLSIGEIQKIHMQKIEENVRYLIQLHQENTGLRTLVSDLMAELEQVKQRVEILSGSPIEKAGSVSKR